MEQHRPYSANPAIGQKKLGSTCPIIIKHVFPKEYDDDEENTRPMSSYKKRFRYDRPITADAYGKRSGSARRNFFDIDAEPKNPRPGSSDWNVASKVEFITNILKNGGQREKNEIKPLKKLNTYTLHNILYKMKQQKEDLDDKISKLENVKNDFTEKDLCVLQNTHAIDYILNLNAKVKPDGEAENFLNMKKQQKLEKDQQKLSKIRDRELQRTLYSVKRAVNTKHEIMMAESDENEFKILGNSALIYEKSQRDPERIRAIQDGNNNNTIQRKINSYIDQYSHLRKLLKEEQPSQDRDSENSRSVHENPEAQQHLNIRKGSADRAKARSNLSSAKKTPSTHQEKNEDPFRTKVFRQGMPRPATANSSNRPNITIPSVRPKNFFFRDNEKIFYDIEPELEALQVSGMKVKPSSVKGDVESLRSNMLISNYTPSKELPIESVYKLYDQQKAQNQLDEKLQKYKNRPKSSYPLSKTEITGELQVFQTMTKSQGVQSSEEAKRLKNQYVVDGSLFSNQNIKNSFNKKERPMTANSSTRSVGIKQAY